MFQVLSTRPKTERTGETFQVYEDGKARTMHWERVTSWPVIGIAKDLEDARKRFGGRPVLGEWIGETH